jgi:hypothetical protein
LLSVRLLDGWRVPSQWVWSEPLVTRWHTKWFHRGTPTILLAQGVFAKSIDFRHFCAVLLVGIRFASDAGGGRGRSGERRLFLHHLNHRWKQTSIVVINILTSLQKKG